MTRQTFPKPKSLEDAEDEKPIVVDFKKPEDEHIDNIMEHLYGKKNDLGSAKNYDTTKLRQATSIPLDKLTEEALNEIEQTPAYKRRSN